MDAVIRFVNDERDGWFCFKVVAEIKILIDFNFVEIVESAGAHEMEIFQVVIFLLLGVVFYFIQDVVFNDDVV